MSPAERLARFAVAVQLLADLESRLEEAIELGTIVPGEIPEEIGAALRQRANDALRFAPGWDDLVTASRALNTPEPSGGREGYAAYLQSLALYGSSTSELVQ